MAKTIARHRTRTNNRTISHDVERMIRKAMTQSGAKNMTKKLKHLITDSIDTAKDKTENLHRNVGRIAHKKPYTSLGLAALTGALLVMAINKRLGHHHHRR